MASKPPPNLFEKVVAWFKEAAEWVQENLGDPAVARTLREDLGLKPGDSLPQADKDHFQALATGLDPDKAALDATIAEISEVVAALKNLGDSLKDGGSGQSAWDVAYLIGQVALTDTIRLRFPAVYALLKFSLFITDDPEEVERLDPSLLMRMLRGEAPQAGGLLKIERVMAGIALVPAALEAVLDKLDAPVDVDYFYGWDPIVPNPTRPLGDLASARTLTMSVGKATKGALTVTGVPPEHQGPGLMFALGGDYTGDFPAAGNLPATKIQFGAAGGLVLYVPLKGGGDFWADSSGPDVFAKLTLLKAGAQGKPAFVVGEATETRLEFGKVGGGIELFKDHAAVLASIHDGALVVTPGKADSFLAKFLSGDIRIGFDIGVRLDSRHGFVIEGGTGLTATIPIEKTVLDALTIHHLTLGLGPSTKPGKDLAIEASGAFGLVLGPFQASVDRLGFTLDLAFGKPDANLGFVDLSIGFKPPNGIGLLLDAAVIKGGGYLYIDADKGEYAGALELKLDMPVIKVGIKAIGVLTTRMPDGSDGWALLLLIYGEFPPIQLGWGFTLNALGGMIGLQHGVSVDALVAGMSSGVLDDILFPAHPVADAPRIINRLRTVFPVTPRALILGPMVEIGWGAPISLIKIRMGVILQMDNVLGSGPQPISFGRVVILGQLRVDLPTDTPSDATFLKLLVDFVGAIEVDPFRLGFVARLRDSYAGKGPFKVDFGGMLVVRAQFGDKPTFVVAAGGFHPDFHDIPPGLPAPIERIYAAFPINVIKVRIEGYFATTPASIQAGAKVSLTAKLGPVSLEASIGFDAICYLKPVFKFDVKIYGSAAIKFKGHNLCGISFEFRLEGPGLWHAKGYGKFSILFWDIDVPFDESWGASTTLPAQSANAAALVSAELATPGNWTAQMPIGGDPMVSLASVEGVTQVLAHPLGTLAFTQRAIPFDLALDKVGQATIDGANRFTITNGYVGAPGNTHPATPLPQHFAVGEFRNLTDAEKLNNPGFQPFTAGARFGDTDYAAGPAAPDQTMEYETLYLKPDVPRHLALDRVRLASFLSGAQIGRAARRGAAARSRIGGLDRMIPANPAKIVVNEPTLATATTQAMAQGAIGLAGGATASQALAHDALAAAGGAAAGLQVVERFEFA